MRATWGLVLALAMPVQAAAETDAEPRLVGYSEALNLALEANPDLGAARLSHDAAKAGFVSANGMFDPVLNIDGGYAWSRSVGFFQGFPFQSTSSSWDTGVGVSGTSPVGTSVSLSSGFDRNSSTFITNFGANESEQLQDAFTSRFDLSLTQDILRGHRLSYNTQNVKSASRTLDNAELSVEQSRQQVLANTANGYWNWVYLEELAIIQEEAVEVAQEELRVGLLKVDAGEMAPVERTRLQTAVVQAKSNALAARNNAFDAADRLALLMGAQPGMAMKPSSGVGEVPFLEIDPARAVDVALGQNLDLMLSASGVEQARWDHVNAKHAMLPSLSATAATGVVGQDETAGGAWGSMFTEAFPYVSLRGNFSVPLGNRAAKGSARAALADLRSRELRHEELQRSIRSAVHQQVRVLMSSRQQVELADANLRLARETLVGEEALFDAGRTILKDVLESRAAVDQARGEAVRARTSYRQGEVELLRLQGQLTVAPQ